MKTLSIETSSRSGEIALMEQGRSVAHQALDVESNSARTLVPTIAQLLEEEEWETNQLELICVTTGPGSFTGLRIGVTTAKVLAYATGAKVVGVNTLYAIAHAVAQLPDQPIRVVLDAQRRQLFGAVFVWEPGGGVSEVSGTALLEHDQFLETIRPGDLVAGTGLIPFENDLRSRSDIQVAAADQWRPSARAVGEIGCRRAVQADFDDLWSLVPDYFRLSAAEEKARAKLK